MRQSMCERGKMDDTAIRGMTNEEWQDVCRDLAIKRE